MSALFDQRVLTVVSAIKQAIVTGSSPGLSVNTHPNMFFLHVNGELDLKRVAEMAMGRLDAYDEQVRKTAELEAVKVAASAGEPLVRTG